jgi:hypothetical protein
MSYLWGQAKAEVGRLLSDASASQTYGELLRLDAFNHALEAFAFHTAVATSTSWTADGDLSSFDLPENAVEGLAYIYIWDETNEEWWSPLRLRPGRTFPDPTPAGSSDYKYYEWPTGKIQLASVPASGTVLRQYYYAHYNALVNDDSTIDVPVWARLALLYFASAYCINPSATNASKLGQFKQKEDAGNPEHNPFEKRQKSFMDMYYRILSEHAPQEKSPPFLGLRP